MALFSSRIRGLGTISRHYHTSERANRTVPYRRRPDTVARLTRLIANLDLGDCSIDLLRPRTAREGL